jgi:hypothetical protein
MLIANVSEAFGAVDARSLLRNLGGLHHPRPFLGIAFFKQVGGVREKICDGRKVGVDCLFYWT